MTLPHGLDPEGPDLLTAEVADRLRVTPRTVIRYAADGRFPKAYRMRGAWRIPQASVIAFIRSNERG